TFTRRGARRRWIHEGLGCTTDQTVREIVCGIIFMKADPGFFGLENAGWPALLVDPTSTIHRANQAAFKLFGAALASASPLLSVIWAEENTSTPEQFLAQWERAPAPTVWLRFRPKEGNGI